MDASLLLLCACRWVLSAPLFALILEFPWCRTSQVLGGNGRWCTLSTCGMPHVCWRTSVSAKLLWPSC